MTWPISQVVHMVADLGSGVIDTVLGQQVSLSKLAPKNCLSCSKQWQPDLQQDWEGTLVGFSMNAGPDRSGAQHSIARLRLERLLALLG